MRKVAPIHPEAQKVLGIIAEMEKGVVPPVPMAEMRALMKKRTARLAAVPPPVASIRDMVIEDAGCVVPVRLYHPRKLAAGETVPALVYAHGGGFAVGDLDMVETICRTVCHDAGVAVVSVDYRLSPENKFPKGLDDVTAVTRHLAAKGAALGIDSARIGIGGDSAGGNLAAAACQALHGRDGFEIRYQVLVYPVTDLTCSQPSYTDLGTGYPLTKERMVNYINLYLTDPAKEAGDVRASPLLAKSFAGQPPTLVIVAGLDPLVDEGIAYAKRITEAGGKAEVMEVPDHPHGFLGWSREAEASRKALHLMATRVREHL